MSSSLWSNKESAYRKAIKYIKNRQSGKIKSWLTPYSKLNDAVVNGLEWNSLIIIGGRPGTGKTLIKDQIINESFKINKEEDFRVLEFSLEMVDKVSIIREFSSVTQKSYKDLCSANNPISDPIINACVDHAKGSLDNKIDLVTDAPTVEEFIRIIMEYMKQHIFEKEDGTKSYTNTVVTLDHSVLLKKSKQHSTKTDMLYDLGEAITLLKRKYPIIFIVLSQLGRGVDTPERNENGKYGNYILESDIFGGDALYQHADVVIGINRPAKRKIKYYGPERYVIDNEDVLVWHFLKCRNGDTRMCFFEAQFQNMRIKEIPPPQNTN